MTRHARIGVAAAAIAAIVLAFVLLRPSDDKPATTAATTTTRTVVATTKAPTGTVTVTRTTVTRPKVDRGPLLTAKKVTKFSVDGGDTVRFRVRSDVPEEVHVHGYDILREVPAGKTVNVSFKASIEGGFEIEFERSATPIGQLSVQP
mgnify:CR=1 FL=1